MRMTVGLINKAQPAAPPGTEFVPLTDNAQMRFRRYTGGIVDGASVWLRKEGRYATAEAWLIFPRRSHSGRRYGWRIEPLMTLPPEANIGAQDVNHGWDFDLPPQGVICQLVAANGGLTFLVNEECVLSKPTPE